MSTTTPMTLLPLLNSTASQLLNEFDLIPAERKKTLQELTRFVQEKSKAYENVYLNFICTHNSRRSHLSQLWAQVGAYVYNVPHVFTFSGGTEATAFNPRAVKAMRDAGFDISVAKEGDNPIYNVQYAYYANPVTAFSKKYHDPFNHNRDFAAIMTCSHADENCPLVIGASARIALTYDDPKEFDGTPLEEAKYKERVLQIGREILYAFSLVNAQQTTL